MDAVGQPEALGDADERHAFVSVRNGAPAFGLLMEC